MKMEIPLTHHIEERTLDDINKYFQPAVYIEYCKACSYYGKIWTCPPYDFDVAKHLESFRYIYVIGSKLSFGDLMGELKELTDRESPEHAFNEIYKVARKELDEKLMQLEKNGQRHALLAGRCLQCKSCTRESGQQCIYPEKAHLSLESLGYDVASISEDILGDKIKWMKGSLPEYMTMVSAVLSRERMNIQDIYSNLQ